MGPIFTPKTLAIDYGLARIGLAVSHGSLAEPLKVIPNTNLPQIVGELQLVITNEQIQQLVVGISAREMADKTKVFIGELQQHIKLPIFLVDEAYSTKVASEKLHLSSASSFQKKGPVDHYAAAEFLQDWLDEQ